MTYRLCVGAFALACVVVLAPAVRAVTVVNDTWKDGTDDDPAATTYSENGVDADADGDIESAWFQGGIGSLNPTGANGPLQATTFDPMVGQGTASTSATWTTYFVPEGQEVNLANDGDALRVTWNFKLTHVNAGNTSQNFRFGIVDATARSTANGSLPSTANYLGYAMFANMGPTLNVASSFQLRERTLATTGKLFDNSGDFTALANAGTRNNTGYVADQAYSMVWTMTHTGDNLDFHVTMSGGSINNSGLIDLTFSDITPTSLKFDTFGVRPSGEASTASIIDTSLFKVEFLPGGGGPADNANFDGINSVTGDDFLIWQRNNGSPGTQPMGDANHNGTVDGADLGIWQAQYGTNPSAASVPEATSLVCGLLAILGAAPIVRGRAAR